MLVSEYRTFVRPSASVARNEQVSAKKESNNLFRLPKKSLLPTRPPRSPLPNYIQNKNYYANKERFANPNQPQTLQRIQLLTKMKQLPEAYSASFVTFMDLTKPKKALTSHRFTLPKSVDEKYNTLRIDHAKTLMAKTYIANDLYFRQAYAS